MTTPEGWAYANLWYDQFRGIPEHGSPLESVLLLVFLDRQHAQLLQTRALVQTQVLALDNKAHQDSAIQAFQQYADTMYSFLRKAEDTKPGANKDHERLLRFVAKPVTIDLRPVWKAKIQQREAKLRRSTRTRTFGIQQPTMPADLFAPPRK